MSEPVVRVRDLAKRYRIGERHRPNQLREVLTSAASAPFRRLRGASNGTAPSDADVLWALNGVTFDVGQGEVLGLIGRNGAGKSTLLKILTRITEPTRGYAEIEGRVSSLLEVGTGFHPELTGRENIQLNGAILGMRQGEVRRKFTEIVEFAELNRFIDTPVKYYSSGMYTRLAFSVAAHLEPDVLIIDEVLAVGDASFQAKCLGKMNDVAKSGRTILFVSHNMTAVQALCNRAIWIDQGQIVENGEVRGIIARYLQTTAPEQTERTWDEVESAPGTSSVRLSRVAVRALPEDGGPDDLITVSTPFVIEVEYWVLDPRRDPRINLVLSNEEGVEVFYSGPGDETALEASEKATGNPGLYYCACYVPGSLLNNGVYRVALTLYGADSHNDYEHGNAITFTIEDDSADRGDFFGEWKGVIRPILDWKMDFVYRLDDEDAESMRAAARSRAGAGAGVGGAA